MATGKSGSRKKTIGPILSKSQLTPAQKKLIRQESLTKEKLADVMADESDRGCVLVALDFISSKLRELLSAYFRKSSGIHDKDLDYLFVGPLALLSDIGSRSNLAFACGLIEADIWQVINQIRQLRNIVGHSEDKATLSVTAAESIISSFQHFTSPREEAVMATGLTLQTRLYEKGLSLEKQALLMATVIVFAQIDHNKLSIISPESI